VIAGGTARRAGRTPLSLGTTQRDLEIHFTALSFLAPANVRFRYRLEPYDAAWVDAGNRRSAFYTKVPPGHYTFRVKASNNDGVWNEQGASLELDLAPHLWETAAFRIAVMLTLGLLVVTAVGWRVRLLRMRTLELGRLVDERTHELRAQQQQLETQTEQLKELDHAKSHFFANVSHEFRTPLTLTIGPLEDLRAEFDRGTRGPLPKQLDMALRNSRRLLRLVNQILDVAKLEAGQMTLRASRQDLVAFARGVAAAFAQIAEQKRITFDVTASPAEVWVWFDGDALEKVLANLLSHAFKFTPDGGRIALSVVGDNAVVRLAVADTGPGIAAEHLAHVFERFYQVDESNTRAQPGTGIGLALAKELVELHGGSIAVESRGGAVFTVTLPLGRAHLRDDQIAPEIGVRLQTPRLESDPDLQVEPSEPAGELPTLLVVDDSADMRTYVRAHFESRYRVLEAGDGADGIERARLEIPDLVISDVMMPGTDGNTLCRALKGDSATDFIPIILLTARTSTEDRVAGLVGGADDYLAKPFEMRELDARVENLIASRRRLRERFATERVELPPRPRQPALSSTDQAFVDRLHAIIANRLTQPEFNVTELARELFLDRTHLFRRTRELVGETPSELIRRFRMERAKHLFEESAGSVAEVAYGVGFQSVSHFSQVFREAYGVSPSDFRERLAAK
jgi:signal transduction histidine kinase/DNA-binding response OmpR family regulator